jgi:hypothetical protein
VENTRPSHSCSVRNGRGEETLVQLAALLLKERQRRNELNRCLDVLTRINELLEVVERKGG